MQINYRSKRLWTLVVIVILTGCAIGAIKGRFDRTAKAETKDIQLAGQDLIDYNNADRLEQLIQIEFNKQETIKAKIKEKMGTTAKEWNEKRDGQMVVGFTQSTPPPPGTITGGATKP